MCESLTKDKSGGVHMVSGGDRVLLIALQFTPEGTPADTSVPKESWFCLFATFTFFPQISKAND